MALGSLRSEEAKALFSSDQLVSNAVTNGSLKTWRCVIRLEPWNFGT